MYNKIFFGPPGTGKSYKIDHMLEHSFKILKANGQFPANRVIRVTFHPESSYFDFVGSYKPKTAYVSSASSTYEIDGKTEIQQGKVPSVYYDFEPGPFSQAIKCAGQTTETVFLIIEEINRGNVAAIFGDIFQLLDRDPSTNIGRYSIRPSEEWKGWLSSNCTQQSNHGGYFNEQLTLPSNLCILATMNTSDQSLYPIDSAFLRRWDMEYIGIDYTERKIKIPLLSPTSSIDWSLALKTLNKHILDKTQNDSKLMGPWFIIDSTPETIQYKLLFYLWDKVFADNRADCFHDKCTSFESLLERYQDENAKIFKDNLQQKLEQ